MVLYLFAGEERKASVKSAIADIARAWAPDLAIRFIELDVCRGGAARDLSDPLWQAEYVAEARQGL